MTWKKTPINTTSSSHAGRARGDAGGREGELHGRGLVYTANADPPMMLRDREPPPYPKGIRQSGTFSVNIPSRDLLVKTDYCGLVSGAKVDKSGSSPFLREARECPHDPGVPRRPRVPGSCSQLPLPTNTSISGRSRGPGPSPMDKDGSPTSRPWDPLLLTIPTTPTDLGSEAGRPGAQAFAEEGRVTPRSTWPGPGFSRAITVVRGPPPTGDQEVALRTKSCTHKYHAIATAYPRDTDVLGRRDGDPEGEGALALQLKRLKWTVAQAAKGPLLPDLLGKPPSGRGHQDPRGR